MSGCATVYNPATEKREFIFINDSTETALGKSVSEQVSKKEKILHDPALEARLERIGKKIAGVSDRPLNYEFHLLDNKELNAFSLPGGIIYIYKGLFNKLNDDELAFVLGHEVGHVAARHAVKKLQSDMTFQLILTVAFAAAGGQADSGAAELAKATDTMFNLISLGYSRQDEYLADRLGVKYAFKSGFIPSAAITALEKIKGTQESGSKVLEYLRTHPYVDERIKAVGKEMPSYQLR